MRLSIIESQHKNTQISINGLIDEFDAWHLPPSSSFIRRNMFNDEMQEITWRDLLERIPEMQKGYNLYINHLVDESEVNFDQRTDLSFSFKLVSSFDKTNEIEHDVSMSGYYDFKIDDSLDLIETTFTFPVNFKFPNSYVLALKNLQCNDFPVRVDEVHAKAKTRSWEIISIDFLRADETGSDWKAKGEFQKAIEIVELTVKYSFYSVCVLREYVSLLLGRCVI